MSEATWPAPAAPSFGSVLAKLRQKRQELAPQAPDRIVRLERGAPLLPLSFGQQRLWFLEQLQPGTAIYNVVAAVRLEGALDPAALARALALVAARHETLRTTFQATETAVGARIHPPPRPALPRADLSALARPESTASALVSQLAGAPFDLRRDPMLRAALLVLDEGIHVLVFAVHHIATDAWSMGVLVRDVAKLYEAVVAGRAPALPELPIQYVDYAAWQRRHLQGEELARQLAYWREQLAGSRTLLGLPTDRPRPPAWSARGSRIFLDLGRDLTARLHGAARQQAVTLFVFLVATFQALLHRATGASDVLLGVPIANRRRSEIQHLIGFFVNTLVLRSRAVRDESFAHLLARTGSVALDAFEHQDLPFEKLVEELQPERALSHSPLFQAVFVFQNIPVGKLELPGLTFSSLPVDRGAAMFDLTCNLAEIDGSLRGWLEHSRELFDAATVARLAAHLENLLTHFAADVDAALDGVPLLDAAELHQLVREWNDTRWEHRPAVALHHLFEAQADRTPDAIAAAFAGAYLSCAELDRRANRLAHRLAGLGVRCETPVGICAERSLEMVVGLFAILKAGAAYVPLDPDHPRERLGFVLADAGVTVLLTQERLAGRLPHLSASTVLLDGGGAALAAWPASRPAPGLAPDNLAYVIYTSGSTGRPKGAMNSHRALVNRLLWMQSVFGLDASDTVLQKTPFAFDVSVWEIFWPPATGARLVLALPGGHGDPDYLAATIADERVTTLHFVPSMLPAFLEARGLERCRRPLRRVIASGEALRGDLVGTFHARLPGPRLYNLYGPTEAAIDVTAWPCAPAAADRPVPIGRPIANLRILLLDAGLGAVPLGAPGELYIGGIGLARGYAGRPDLTAERFLPAPFAAEPGARMYRSGDLARYRPDGAIEYLGRTDFQVKIRGFRIELEEIEAILAAHAEVREAVVLARDDAPGDPRLVAYVAPREGASPLATELARHLAAALPAYMVPSSFVLLDALPLTANGKVDRQALPAPAAPAGDSRDEAASAPRGQAEALLSEIWADVLRLPRVGIHDNFFALGGHSLLAPRTVGRIRQAFGIEVPLSLLFQHPTVAGLADAMAAARGRHATAAEPPLRRAAGSSGPRPLTPAQRRFWRRRGEGEGLFNSPWAVLLTGRLDAAALGRAFAEIVRRHEPLRTRFLEIAGEPVQEVRDDEPFTLGTVDLTGLPALAREREVRGLGALVAALPFDLARDRLMRAMLVRLGAAEHALFVVKHHMVTDGWSEGVLAEELSALYQAYADGRPSPLPELPLQYGDFASWQQALLGSGAMAELRRRWRERLHGLVPLALPTDQPRPAVRSVRGGLRQRTTGEALSRAVRQLGRRESASLFMTLLAAWKALLALWTGQRDIALTTNVAHRSRPELFGLIGLFTNLLVLRTELGGDPTFRELLGRVRDTTLDTFADQDLPFVEILDHRLAGAASHDALFPAGFVLQNVQPRPLTLPQLATRRFDLVRRTAPRDLILLASEQEAELELMLLYREDIFTAATMDRLLARLVALLEAVCHDPGRRLSSLAEVLET
jgi:amino acid adenylation domain-containing protein